jgi:hypothetical protein
LVAVVLGEYGECQLRPGHASTVRPAGNELSYSKLDFQVTAKLKPILATWVAFQHMLIRGNAGHSDENYAMQQGNNWDWSRDIPSSLNFSQEQVVFFIGHSLRSLYDDVLAADMPDHLKTLVLKLEETYPP